MGPAGFALFCMIISKNQELPQFYAWLQAKPGTVCFFLFMEFQRHVQGQEQSRLPSQDSLVYSEVSSQEEKVRFLQESACSRGTIPQCAILFWPDLLETGTSCHRVSSRGWKKKGNDLFLLWCLFLKDMQGLPLVLILPKCHNCVEAPVQLHHFSRPGHLNLQY